MSIVILVYGKTFSQELLKDLFLVTFIQYIYIYIDDIFFYADEEFLTLFCSKKPHL